MARDLIVVGAGGHGRELFGLLRAINDAAPAPVWTVVGFADDADLDVEAGARLDRLDSWVAASVDAVAELSDDGVVAAVALGDPAQRAAVTARLVEAGVQIAPALVHPTASTGLDVRLGAGVLVAAGSHLTTNIDVGPGAQINVGCTVSHDVVLGAHATLSPGCHLTGGVTVGEGAFFGAGAVVAPRITVGAGARVGAGAVVLDDVEPGVTVYGVPARPQRTSSS